MQNTDPFVFGDQFHYTGCLQHTKRGATQLRYLDRGSVILFGSCREKRDFVVDTVSSSIAGSTITERISGRPRYEVPSRAPTAT
jgi:hypothetical protein